MPAPHIPVQAGAWVPSPGWLQLESPGGGGPVLCPDLWARLREDTGVHLEALGGDLGLARSLGQDARGPQTLRAGSPGSLTLGFEGEGWMEGSRARLSCSGTPLRRVFSEAHQPHRQGRPASVSLPELGGKPCPEEGCGHQLVAELRGCQKGESPGALTGRGAGGQPPVSHRMGPLCLKRVGFAPVC